MRSQYIALGSNLTSPFGGPKQTMHAALEFLRDEGATLAAVSPYYSTPAFPVGSGPEYVNAVAELRADWTPAQALKRLHAVEARIGRTRTVRWGTRTVDLDLIAVGDEIAPNPEVHAHWRDLPLEQQMKATPDQLILPHPRLQDRAFVLVPMAAIAPDWVHPLLGLSVQQMLDALPEALKAEVRPLPDTK